MNLFLESHKLSSYGFKRRLLRSWRYVLWFTQIMFPLACQKWWQVGGEKESKRSAKGAQIRNIKCKQIFCQTFERGKISQKRKDILHSFRKTMTVTHEWTEVKWVRPHTGGFSTSSTDRFSLFPKELSPSERLSQFFYEWLQVRWTSASCSAACHSLSLV